MYSNNAGKEIARFLFFGHFSSVSEFRNSETSAHCQMCSGATVLQSLMRENPLHRLPEMGREKCNKGLELSKVLELDTCTAN